MKAVVCRAFGDPENLSFEDVESPPLSAGQLRIAVRKSSLNFFDVLMVQGLYQRKPPFPFVVGTDAAGEVSEIAKDIRSFKVGDRVMVFNWSGGAFADEMVVSEANALLLPSAIDFASAAALKSTYGTALYALTTRARLGRNEALLVLGAAGGIGQATLEIGKLLSSTVIAAVGSEAKVRLLKELGTEQVINYSSENLRDRVRELTTGKGADVIIDPVGGELFDQAIRAIAWGGRLCVLGFASGHIPKLSINQVLLKSFDLVGVNYGGWVDSAMEAQRSQTQQLIGWCAEGKIRPNASATMGLAEVPLAMRQMLERSTFGKIVFSPSNLSANP